MDRIFWDQFVLLCLIYVPKLILCLLYRIDVPSFESKIGYKTGFSLQNEKNWIIANKLAAKAAWVIVLLSFLSAIAISVYTKDKFEEGVVAMIVAVPLQLFELIALLLYVELTIAAKHTNKSQ